jgi:hypothetical protein
LLALARKFVFSIDSIQQLEGRESELHQQIGHKMVTTLIVVNVMGTGEVRVWISILVGAIHRVKCVGAKAIVRNTVSHWLVANSLCPSVNGATAARDVCGHATQSL